jgi:hypothetical protein
MGFMQKAKAEGAEDAGVQLRLRFLVESMGALPCMYVVHLRCVDNSGRHRWNLASRIPPSNRLSWRTSIQLFQQLFAFGATVSCERNIFLPPDFG